MKTIDGLSEPTSGYGLVCFVATDQYADGDSDRANVSLSPDDARLFGLALIRSADRAEESPE